MNRKKLVVLISVVVTLVILMCVGIYAVSENKLNKIEDKLDMGEKYLEELEYEKALAMYREVLKIDPMNVEAYLGMVDTYIAMGDFENALKYAEEGYEETGDEELEEKMEEVRALMHGGQTMVISEDTTMPETTPEPVTEPDWLINGIPHSNIKNMADYTVGGVPFTQLTPQLLLDMYGTYENTYEDMGVQITESGTYVEQDTMETISYDLYVSNGKGYRRLCALQHTGWEEVSVTGRDWAVGFADIYLGEDYFVVMEKLGFTKEQADWIKKRISEGEENTWYCNGRRGWISFEDNLLGYSSGFGEYVICMPVSNEEGDKLDHISFGFDSDFKLYCLKWARNV